MDYNIPLGQNFCHGQRIFCLGQIWFCPGQKIFCLGRWTGHKTQFHVDLVTFIEIRLCGSQNFEIKKMQISCFIIRKIENLIFEGIKLKTARIMYFQTKLIISEWFLGIFHFLVYYCGFQFFPHEAYFRVKLKKKKNPQKQPLKWKIPQNHFRILNLA